MLTVSVVEPRVMTCAPAELVAAAGVGLPALREAVADLVDLRRSFVGDAIDLVPGTTVGTIVVGDLRIDVRPRLANADLVALIRYAYGDAYRPIERSRVAMADDDGLDELLGRVLADELAMIRQRGVSRRYDERRERVSAVRGRVDFVGSFPWNERGTTTLACRYHELSCDNLDNRLIAAALGDVGPLALHAPTRARLVAQRHAWQTLVPATPPVKAADFAAARGRYTRLNAHYALAHHLCEAIVARRRPRAPFDASAITTGGLSLDMARLFERVVERLLRDALVPLGYRVGGQSIDRGAMRDASGACYATIRPDVLVHRGDRVVAVVDAKYKDYWDADAPGGEPRRRVDNGDLYQLFFYAARHRRAGISPPAIIVAPVPDADAIDSRPRIDARHRSIRLHAGGAVNRLSLALLPLSAISRGDASATEAFVRTIVTAFDRESPADIG